MVLMMSDNCSKLCVSNNLRQPWKAESMIFDDTMVLMSGD
jgi:hypothetical protein